MNLNVKSIPYVLFFICLSFIACNESNFKSEFSGHKKEVYQQAMQNGDYEVATQAIYDILASQPSENAWRDSLALLYAQQKAYPQALKISEQQIAKNPNDTLMLKVQALSYKSMGNPKKSLEAYEKLYPLTQNVYHLYEIATIQYSMTRLQECLVTAKSLHAHKGLGEARINLNFNQQNQVVPLKAAVYNIQGVVAKDLDKQAEAKAFFEQALKVAPDFSLAKGNLEQMKG